MIRSRAFLPFVAMFVVLLLISCVSQPEPSRPEPQPAPVASEPPADSRADQAPKASKTEPDTKIAESGTESISRPEEKPESIAKSDPVAVPAEKPAAVAQPSPPKPTKPAQPETVAPVPATSATKPVETAQPAKQPTTPEKKVGDLTFFTGKLSLYRDGKKLTGKNVEVGSAIRNYDLIQTGPKSTAEIDLDASYSGGALIKLSEKTAFWFETSSVESKRKTNMELLAGSVLLKVAKLSGNDSVSVKTESGVLGVRGTVFAAITSPDGKTLVTCVEGAVACKDKSGATNVAKPGQVVKDSEGGKFAVETVAPDQLVSYRDTWFADRLAYFSANAPAIINGYASAIMTAEPAFDTAYSALASKAGIFTEWEKALAAGKSFGFVETSDQRKIVAPLLFDALKALFPLERPLVRLTDIRENYMELIPSASITGANKTSFEAIYARADLTLEKISRVRSWMRVFSAMAGDSPLGEFFGEKAAGSSLLDDDFFND